MAFKTLLLGTVFDFEGSRVSIDLDGSTERMGNEQGNSLGVAGAFTYLMWVKRPALVADRRPMEVIPQSGNNNRIIIETMSVGGLTMVMFSASGVFMKSFNWTGSQNVWPVDTWTLLGMTWNNTGSTFLGYFDGVNITQDSGADNAGVHDNSSSDLDILEPSNRFATGLQEGEKFWSAWWDTDLSSASILSIFNAKAGANLQSSFDNYAQSSNLVHWWRWGFNSTDIGEDSGSSPIDMDVDSVDVTSDDIVSDVPA